MPSEPMKLVDISLTNECLHYFEEKDKNSGKLNSFLVVRLGGSLCAAGTAVSDTLIQLAACIVKLTSGGIISPVNLFLVLFTDKRLSENWDWSMATEHLGQSLKHFTAIFIVPLSNLRSGPAETRRLYFSKQILQDHLKTKEALCTQQQKVIQDNETQIALLKNQLKALTNQVSALTNVKPLDKPAQIPVTPIKDVPKSQPVISKPNTPVKPKPPVVPVVPMLRNAGGPPPPPPKGPPPVSKPTVIVLPNGKTSALADNKANSGVFSLEEILNARSNLKKKQNST